ncbi:MAG: calcium-binding protein [Kineosporiaceae bacterium]
MARSAHRIPGIAIGALVAALLTTLPSPADAAVPTVCGGLTVTIVGTDGPDTLVGTSGNDVIAAGAGDDVINASGGNDVICPGGGNDTITADVGTDTLVFEGTAAVTANLSTGTATGATSGTDTFTGVENLTGADGSDSLTGDGANNVLVGGLGNDALNGGGGTDTVSYATATSGVTVRLGVNPTSGGGGADTLTAVENVVGSPFADVLVGDGLSNTLDGGRGNDDLDGAGGADTAAFSGAAAVTATLATSPGSATDTTTGSDILRNMEGLTGGSGADRLTGSAAANTLRGASGTDTCVGGDGSDTLIDCETVTLAVTPTSADTVNWYLSSLQTAIFLDSQAFSVSASGDLRWSMTGPSGSTVMSARTASVDYLADGLTTPGTYRLVVTPSPSTATGSVTFTARIATDSTRTVGVGTSLASTAATALTTTAPGQNVRVSFTYTQAMLDAGLELVHDLSNVTGWPTGCCTRVITLTRPNGTTFTGTYLTAGPTTWGRLDATGTWTLTFDIPGTATGSAQLKLIAAPAFARTVPVGTSLATTAATPITTTDPGQNVRVSFTYTQAMLDAGLELVHDLSNVTGWPTGCCTRVITLTRPNGTTFTGTYLTAGPTTWGRLDATGTWTLTFDIPGTATGSAQLKLIAAPAFARTVPVGTSLATTAATPITTTDPGQNVRVSFTYTQAMLDAGLELVHDLSNVTGWPTGCCTRVITLTRPNGTTFTGTYLTAGPTTWGRLDATGTWTLTFDIPGTATGSAQLKLIAAPAFARTVPVGTSLATTAATPITTTDPGQNVRVSFTYTQAMLDAGLELVHDLSNVTGWPTGCCTRVITLTRPNGTTFTGTYLTAGPTTWGRLDATGTWTLTFDIPGTATGSAQLKLAAVPPA